MTVQRDRAPGEGYLIAWSGSMSAAERDAQTALRKEGVRVEQVPATRLSPTVAQRAPDLIVLGQRADERAKLVEALAEVHPYVPVVALTDVDDARPQPRARFGLVARLDREQPSPELAAAIRDLLDGFSRRLPRWRVQADLDDIPQVARRAAVAGRSGLLSATGGGAVALDSDGRIGPDPKLFVASLVGIPELELTLYERPPGSVRVFREPPPAAHGDLTQARVLLVDPDPSRFAALAEGFREFEGVKVVCCTPAALAGERALDPMAIVLSSETLLEPDCTPLWEDARYVPGGLLVLEGRALTTTVDGLAAIVAGYAAPERAVVGALRKGQPVASRLETLGTARWLKVLGQCRHDVTLRVFSAAGRARVDLSEGKIQGASFHLVDRDDVEGRAAVEMLLRLPFGRVLAGPPASLARFDGMRRTRKPSIVGRIVPMEVRGGKIMGEVVVQHTDATVPLFRVPKPVLPPAGFDSFEEDEDEATQAYSSDAMAQLREELADEEAEPASASVEAESSADASVESTPESVAPESSASDAAPPTASEPSAPDDAAPAKKKKKKTKKTKKKAAAASGAKKKSPNKRASKRPPARSKKGGKPSSLDKPSSGTSPLDEPSSGTSSTSAKKSPAPAKTAEARPSVDRVAAEDSGGSAMLWVAALLVLALGGYGLYRMSQPDVEPSSPPPAAASASPAVPTPTVPTQVVPDGVEPARPGAGPDPTAPPAVVDVVDAPSSDEPADVATPSDDPVAPSDEPAAPSDEPAAASDDPAAASDDPAVASDEPAPSGDPAVPSEDPTTPSGDPRLPATISAEPLPPVPTTSAEITERIQASAAAARVRDYARSEALARLVIQASPHNARAAYRIAVAAFRQRHFDEALEWVANAQRWNPQDPLPVSLRGDIHMRRGNFNRAAVAYREALEIEPRFGPARRQLDRLEARGIGVD